MGGFFPLWEEIICGHKITMRRAVVAPPCGVGGEMAGTPTRIVWHICMTQQLVYPLLERSTQARNESVRGSTQLQAISRRGTEALKKKGCRACTYEKRGRY